MRELNFSEDTFQESDYLDWLGGVDKDGNEEPVLGYHVIEGISLMRRDYENIQE